MRTLVEDQPLVDLVGEHPRIRGLGGADDSRGVVSGEDESRGIVRSVDDDECRTVGHRGLERLPVGSESALGLEHRHGDELSAGRRDRGRVGVVVRFERHDPASPGDEGEDRRGQPLRGPTRDEHLLGGDRMAEVLRPSARDRLAEDRVSLPGGRTG